METELATLASTAAGALVQAMTTDGWERIKQAIAGLWRRSSPERIEPVACDLEESHVELLAAREQGDTEIEAGLVTEWQGRFRRLLTADAQAASELRAILALNQVVVGRTVQFGPVTHVGSGDVNQAGRDMTVTKTGLDTS